MNLLLQLLANGLANGATFALVGVGFGLVYRTTGVFHIAYGGIYTLTAYAFYLLVVRHLLSLPLAFALACSIAAVAGCLLETFVYWPFHSRKASANATLIASLGVYVLLENGLALALGSDVKTVSASVHVALPLGPVMVTPVQIWELALCGGAVVGVWLLLCRARVFKAIWAMGDEPDLVAVLGMPYRQLRIFVVGFSSLLVAMPACIGAFSVGVSPHVGMRYLLIGAVVVFFGGLDSYTGWVVGGFLLAAVESLALWQLSSQWTDLITFSFLVAILVLRPQGILGVRKRIEET